MKNYLVWVGTTVVNETEDIDEAKKWVQDWLDRGYTDVKLDCEGERTFFVTFGSAHLEEFNVNPMYIGVYGFGSENDLRTVVRGVIQSDKFCTSYPYSESVEFVEKYGMSMITVQQLAALRRK